jgi:hypothetical protein
LSASLGRNETCDNAQKASDSLLLLVPLKGAYCAYKELLAYDIIAPEELITLFGKT